MLPCIYCFLNWMPLIILLIVQLLSDIWPLLCLFPPISISTLLVAKDQQTAILTQYLLVAVNPLRPESCQIQYDTVVFPSLDPGEKHTFNCSSEARRGFSSCCESILPKFPLVRGCLCQTLHQTRNFQWRVDILDVYIEQSTVLASNRCQNRSESLPTFETPS